MTIIPLILDKEINDNSNDNPYLIFTTLSIWCFIMFIVFSKRIHRLEKQHNL